MKIQEMTGAEHIEAAVSDYAELGPLPTVEQVVAPIAEFVRLLDCLRDRVQMIDFAVESGALVDEAAALDELMSRIVHGVMVAVEIESPLQMGATAAAAAMKLMGAPALAVARRVSAGPVGAGAW